MLTLEAAQTLQGVAGTGTAVSYTAVGDDLTVATGVDAFKVLAQGQLPTSTGVLGTVAAGHAWLIKSITLVNATGSQVSGIKLFIGGSAAANQATPTIVIPANGAAVIDDQGRLNIYDATGTVITTSTTTLTGDVTGSGSGTIATTLATVISAGGPSGSSSVIPVITWDAKGRLTSVSTATITPAAIGAPSGSGTSTGTNTGDQTITLTGDVTGTGTGSFATTLASTIVAGGPSGSSSVVPVITYDAKGRLTSVSTATIALGGDVTGNATATVVGKLQGTAVSSTVPTLGMTLRFGPTSWQPTSHMWNVVNFGADPTTGSDSTLAIYNAHTACTINPGSAYLVTSGTPTTSTSNFSITVTANAAFPATGTGTLVAMTTRGLVYMTFSGGNTTTVTAAVTAGVAGGTILAGSLMGIVSTTQVGGIIHYPAGLYIVSNPIINSIPGVHEMGVAASGNADAGNWGYSGGSWIYYTGTVGDFAMTHVPITGTLGLQAGQALHGIRVTGLNFACSGTSGYGGSNGLRLISCNGWYLEDVFVNEPCFVAYEFTTLGLAMIGEAEDTTRGTAINLRWRALAGPGGASAAQISAAGTAITAGAGTNINTFAGAGTLSTAALTAAAWPTPGLAMVQAIDQLTGNVMDYMVSYTGNAGPGLTGVTTLGLFWNQANSTTLAASAPATGNPKPNALLFAGALVRPAYAAYAIGVRLHGSATANSSVNTFITAQGNHWMGAGWYLGNSDTNKFFSTTMNRTSAGTPTGIGWDVQGATAIAGSNAASRNNRWYGGDPGPGGATFRGTNSYGYTAAASANNWYEHELGNGAPGVTLGTTVQAQITYNGALIPGGVGSPPAAAQALAASTQVVLTGSSIQVPTLGLVANWTWYRWTIGLRKTTAAGTATWTAKVCFGTANTNADTAIATFTSGTNTAIVDSAVLQIDMVVLTLGGTATAQCTSTYTHNPGVVATGLGDLPSIPGTTATFNSGLDNPGPSYFHVDITPGAAAVMTAVCQAQVMR